MTGKVGAGQKSGLLRRLIVRLVENRGWALGAGLAASLVLGVTVVMAVDRDIESGRVRDLVEVARGDAESLRGLTVHSPLMGATTVLGVASREIKEAVAKGVSPGLVEADGVLEAFRKLFDADNAFVVNREGLIAAYQIKSGHSGKGTDVGYRPYFRQAVAGTSNVYVAVGSNTRQRGLYMAAPVRTEVSTEAPVGGAVVIKVGMDRVDNMLRHAGRDAVLVSPEGVVMASSQPEWLFRIVGPVSPERWQALKDGKRFFDIYNAVAPVPLPFSLDHGFTRFDGRRYALIVQPIAWNDQAGTWSLVILEDTGLWLPAVAKFWILFLVVAACAFFMLWMFSIMTGSVTAEAHTKELEQRSKALEVSLARLTDAQAKLIMHEKMASLGQLVAGVAHEINTPLGVAVTASSLLSDWTEELAAGLQVGNLRRSNLERYITDTREGCGLLHSNLQRAAELVRSFKQIAADQSTDERRRFDIGVLLSDVSYSLTPIWRKGGHRMDIFCPEGIFLNGYPGMISQILTNLVTNSVIHGFDPGESGVITVTVTLPDSDTVELCYADNGKGIAANVRDKVFDPFFTTNRGAGSTGLGMHIIYNLEVGKLGGTIDLHTDIDQGVRIVMRFSK